MHFPYGISHESLRRWECFLRIRAVQEQRGSDVGRVALGRIIDAELQAIERATFAEEERGALVRRSRPR